jgi:L-amino acid N-acyltransferase YncA
MTEIIRMTGEHWNDVRRIHAEGIDTGMATFETEPASDWQRWSQEHLECCRLVAIHEGRVVGWAALSRVSDRCVYGGVAEVSIYIGADARGIGVGTKLLQRLVGESEEQGIWTLQAGIFPENGPSVALHEKCGFRTVGRRERLGKLEARWQDVLLLERRSARVGID